MGGGSSGTISVNKGDVVTKVVGINNNRTAAYTTAIDNYIQQLIVYQYLCSFKYPKYIFRSFIV